MCGIAGYVGPRPAVEVVFRQLQRLEYRGYDSAGIAYLDGDKISILKRAGKLSELGKLLGSEYPEARIAIGHSRWATHGGPTDTNAHPHFDQYENISLIHNGIIENYHELKAELSSLGHTFRSETDTEVAAHVIGIEVSKGLPLEEAVRLAVRRLRGAFALVVISKAERNKIVAARSASPIVLGIGDGESFIASDIPALLPFTRRVIILEDERIAMLSEEGLQITDLGGRILPAIEQTIEWDVTAAEKGGFDHFMVKEIHEQPEVIQRSIAGRIDEAGNIRLENIFTDHVWHEIDRVNIIACGTAYHAGLMGKFILESQLRLPTDVFYSSEFRYGSPVLSPKSLAIFISQSGETADSLAALKLCKERRIRTLGLVNVLGSSIARECDRTLYTQAGPEISVASTKAYFAQVLTLTQLALYIAQVQETPGVRVRDIALSLRTLSAAAMQTLQLESSVKAISQELQDTRLLFFIGRGADAYVALEGALKMKEIAYIPTQEAPAGEMKHGPLALIDEAVTTIVGATDAALREKSQSNMKEVQARGGRVIALTTDDDETMPLYADRVLRIPNTGINFLNALLSVIPLQLLAYHTAKSRGCEIDQPRNLAKSVTVE